MAITPLPTPPSRSDAANFDPRAEAFLGALPQFAVEANALASDVADDAQTASDKAAAASTAADRAEAAQEMTGNPAVQSVTVTALTAAADAEIKQRRPTSVLGSYLGRQSAYGYDTANAYQLYGQRRFEIGYNVAGNASGRHVIEITKNGGLQGAEMLTGDEHRVFGAAPYYSGYNQAGTTRYGYIQWDGTDLTISNDRTGSTRFLLNGAEAMRLDSSGCMQLGVPNGGQHTIAKTGPLGANLCNFYSTTYGLATVIVNTADQQLWGGSGAALSIGRWSTNGRSVQAGGTLNASGADYAEYHRKALTCGPVLKGQIVGLDSRRQIVDRWTDAARFKVKSTDPNFVGGDRWSQHLGMRPEALAAFEPPPYSGRVEPASDSPLYDLQLVAYHNDVDAYMAALATARAAYQAAVEDRDAEIAAFDAAVEAERVKYDRIAYAGQCPAIVSGAITVGDYVIAQEAEGGGIEAVCVAEPTSAQRRYIVGWVAVAEPTEDDWQSLLGPDIAPNPAWTAIVDVMQA